MDEQKSWKLAEIEALERAGAIGHVGTNPIGRYCYDKVTAQGAIVVVEVEVFPMVVERLRRDWKNRRTRKRRWFHVLDAAEHVREGDLAELLRSLAPKPAPRTALGRLFSWFD
ncbi:NUDIX hydrolase [Rhodovulum marinum]|nr:NUDIX hydrolase [Rhodovulum marinum]